jgi:hypothetical protein
MRGSLRSCPEALRLEDVLDTNGLVLFSLDVGDYPHATRKVASWILLGMGRLARQLPEMGERTPPSGEPRALLLVDEVGALGSAARHLRGLVGRAREVRLSGRSGHTRPERFGSSRPSAAAPGSPGHGLAVGLPPRLAAGRRAHAGALWQSLGQRRVVVERRPHHDAPGGAAAGLDRRMDERARAW